jgi:hypothetical protein
LEDVGIDGKGWEDMLDSSGSDYLSTYWLLEKDSAP